MTYRDDHDAALARAEALEAELARDKDKHVRLETELARARLELARLRGRPPDASTALEPVDVTALVARLERELKQADPARAVGNAVIAMAIVGAVAVLELIAGWYQAAFPAIGLVALLGVALAAGRRSHSPQAARAVLAAVRDDPDAVEVLDHELDRKDTIYLATATGEVVVTTTDQVLYSDLRRRCPHARPRSSR